MAFESTDSFYEVRNSTVVRGPYPRSMTGLGEKSSDGTLATYGHYRLWLDDGGERPGIYYDKQEGLIIVDEVSVPPRCTRTDMWVAHSSDTKRTNIENRIEQQRLSASRSYIDVQADAGLVALMDEANNEAVRQLNRLGSTADGDLDSFDPTFDPKAANSIQLAASLSRQERAILAAANPFTEQQRSDLALAATQHEAIVDSGDPAAAVPEVPSFARRMIGVLGEDIGIAFARRIFEAGWWWLELGLRIERELDPTEYWFAVYNDTAPDDRDDTIMGYLTTPRLTQQPDGTYLANRMAVNLPSSNTDAIYKFTLCRQHIDNPQFDKVTLDAGVVYEEYRVRWGGLA